MADRGPRVEEVSSPSLEMANDPPVPPPPQTQAFSNGNKKPHSGWFHFY